MNNDGLLPVDRFIKTLEVVYREGVYLSYSWQRLYSQKIDITWVEQLNKNPEQPEILDAFVSRFDRMQDTIADKLLPRWLMALAERPGSQIETLNCAERLGVIDNVEHWLEARKLRNCLIHEYMDSAETFNEYMHLARDYSKLLLCSYNQLHDDSIKRMGIENKLPNLLTIPNLISKHVPPL